MEAAGKSVLIVMTSHGEKGHSGEPTGFFLSEVTHPLAVFEAAGLEVAFASIAGGEPPVDGFDLEDETNARYWNDEQFRAAIRTTTRLADVDLSRFDAIYFAGGHGAMWDFPGNPAVIGAARTIWETGGIVGAVCHGPAALGDVTLRGGGHLVMGRRVAAFTDAEERAVKLETVVPFLLSSRLASRGALLKDAPDWTANVAIDDRLVTGQNPQSATGVGEAMRDLLLGAG